MGQEESKKHLAPNGQWGDAVNTVYIGKDGKMWIGNGEYSTQVNFNPFTGEPAPTQLPKPKITEEGWFVYD